MPEYRIRDVPVSFPHQAYPSQLLYMEKVIQALQESQNALLESPTGTGKTLCLLCATLAFRQEFVRAGGRMRIVYSSRTHSQLQQVMRELKSTVYRPKVCVLGSREQMCVHHDVKELRGTTQNTTCRAHVAAKRCRFHEHMHTFLRNNPGAATEVRDIEELVSFGTKEGVCPFYLSREAVGEAELLFVPYNYLVDPQFRSTLRLSWEGDVLIFDEAHNIESVCGEAASFDLSPATVARAAGEAGDFAEALRNGRAEQPTVRGVSVETLAHLKSILLKLEGAIAEVALPEGDEGFTATGGHVFELLEQAGITRASYGLLAGVLDGALQALQEASAEKAGRARSTRTYSLEAVQTALRLVFQSEGANSPADTHRFYRVHVHRDRDGERAARPSRDIFGAASSAPAAASSDARVLSYWCMYPGLAMRFFATCKLRSVVLTSGTLAPLNSFAAELGIPFPLRLESPHVIRPEQICVGVLSRGPAGGSLNSSYARRSSDEYRRELGAALVNLARVCPHGLLVFFPSYRAMADCIDFWRRPPPPSEAGEAAKSIWERIAAVKEPIVEPRESGQLGAAMAEFYRHVDRGAAFFAVCRGKVSEGLDFSDANGRAVVITGLPYPNQVDPKVRLKRQYLDETRRETGSISGGEWYTQQATRAVNQAVGRVIRHRDDYAAILLADERFAGGQLQGQLSAWLRPHVRAHGSFGEALSRVARFFREAEHSDFAERRRAALAERGIHSMTGPRASPPPDPRPPPAGPVRVEYEGEGPAEEDGGDEFEEAEGEGSAPAPAARPSLLSVFSSLQSRPAPAPPSRPAPAISRPPAPMPTRAPPAPAPSAPPPPPPAPPARPSAPEPAAAPQRRPGRRSIFATDDPTMADPTPLPAPIEAAAAGPSEPRGSAGEAGRPGDTKAFIARVKERLPADGFGEFLRALRDLKALGTLSGPQVDENLTRVRRLLAAADAARPPPPGAPSLVDAFRAFLPSAHRERFAAMAGAGTPPAAGLPERRKPTDIVTGARLSAPPPKRPKPDAAAGPSSLPTPAAPAAPGPPPAPAPAGSSTGPGKGAGAGEAEPRVKCVICLDTCTEPYSSKCGHVACKGCWDAALARRLECSVCRAHTRPKFLTRLFLA